LIRLFIYVILGFFIWRLVRTLLNGSSTRETLHQTPRESDRNHTTDIDKKDIEDVDYEDIEPQ